MNTDEWDQHWHDNWLRYERNRSYRRRVPLLRSFVSGKTLDVGVGAVHVYTQDDDVTGLDISPECVRILQERYPWGKWMVGDALHTGLPESSFDTVICSHVLEHFLEHRLVLEELKRVVKPDGRIVIILPRNSVGPDHVHPKWWPGNIEERICPFLKDATYELRNKDQWVIQGKKTATASVAMIAWSPGVSRMTYMRESLTTLRECTKYPHTLVVVDNGPAEQTEFVRSIGPDIHIVNKQNVGPAESRNMGALATYSDYIAFVDNDMRFYEDWLADTVGWLERYPDRKLIAVPHNCPVMRKRYTTGTLDDLHLAEFGGSGCWVMKRRAFEQIGRWTQAVPRTWTMAPVPVPSATSSSIV